MSSGPGNNNIKINPTNETVSANYSKLSDHIRRLTPQGIQCSVFCGGLNCKYENPENWKADSLAIQGIYSHWITDSILAMARPSTVVIVQKNIIQQFESLGIRSIINLQSPREHASCGQPLEDSGFSYDPNIFMEHNIFYYNFAWKDYGDATLVGLLNMVKVLAFAIVEGRVAVHCHAGLGRTGVLIACYLVYSLRVSANDAITYVRLKRHGSVQTRGQILCVRHFAQFILPQTITYYLKESVNKDKYMNEFTLTKFLKRQKVSLHGYEERNFKYLPKIVFCICERFLRLCGCATEELLPLNKPITSDFLCTKLSGGDNMNRYESSYSLCSLSSDSDVLLGLPSSQASTPSSPNPSENGDHLSDSFSELSTLDGEEMSEEMLLENRCFQQLECEKNFNSHTGESDESIVMTSSQNINDAIDALLTDVSTWDVDQKRTLRQYQGEINNTHMGWTKLSLERDQTILAALLYEWLEGLKGPVLTQEDFEAVVVYYNQPELCFKKFGLEQAYLIEYLMKFVSKIHPLSNEDRIDILKRLVAALAKRSLVVRDETIPSYKGFKKLRDGTLKCTIIFFQNLLELVEAHHSLLKAKNYFEEEAQHDEDETVDE